MNRKFYGRRGRGLALRTGCSALALVVLSQPAYAACDPNPTLANVTTICSGLTSEGIVVSTSGTSLQVTSGAQLLAGTADAGAVISKGYYLSVDGTIAGGSKPGLIVTNGAPLVITSYSDYDPYAGAAPYYLPFGSTYYPSESLQITIGSAGSISGSSAISLQQRSDNASGSVSASINNAGTLSGSAGPALVGGTGSSFSITNQSSGVIGGISGTLASLSNAGLIDGGTGSAIAAPSSSYYYYYYYNVIQNSGQIVSNSTSATILAGPNSISNSGTIANRGTGAAIADTQSLSITNQGTGTISTAGSTAIQTSDVLQLTNRGTITGSVIAGSSGSSGSHIDTVGGTIHGDLLLGSGNDQLIATLDANNHVAEVSGTVDAGGGVDTFTIQIGADTTLASAILPTNFERLDLSLANNASVTLGMDFAAPFGMSIGGSGTLTVTGNIASTGSAFTPSFSSYGYGLSLVNKGTITSTLSDISQSAVSFSYYGGINNSGTITAIGGGGAVVSGQNAINSGTITADGTALDIFSSGGNNSGTITSNQGIGLQFFGSQNQFANSGTITGQTAGALIANVTLTNTGTISSVGRGVALQYYGTLDNRAGGIVNGGVGTLQASSFLYGAKVINAGTINGDVNFGNTPSYYGSGNTFVAASGGVVNGNLYLGSGNDLFVTSLTNDGPGQFAGVTGTVSGGGTETIRYLVDQDSTTTLSTAGIFANVGYQLSNDAKLTLGASATQALSVDLTGSGAVDLTADISQTGDRSILNLNASSVQTTTSSSPTANALDVTSYGTLTQGHTQLYSYAAPAVALLTGNSFTNAGTIIVKDTAPNPYGGLSLAAIAGTGTAVNTGTISVDGAIAVLNNGYYANLNFTNSGSIVQAAGGANGQGVSGASTVANTGSIVTGGPAMVVGSYYGAPSQVTNSGLIQSLNSAAITSGNNYSYVGSRITNQSSGIITGGTASPAILLTPGSTIDNAGTINGDVNLNALPYFYYSPGNSKVINAGTINGDVNFGTSYGSGSNNIFVAASGGIVNGDLYLGNGNDLFVIALTNDGTNPFAGVTGAIRGDGAEAIRYLVDQDASTTLSTAGIFANVGYQLSNDAQLTLAASAAQTLGVDLAGSGTVDLTADISQAGNRSIVNLTATSVLATSSSSANALDVTSHGTLTQSHTQTFSSAAPAVIVSTGSSFTNAGTIIVKEAAPNPYGGLSLAAIAGTGTVVNTGTISVDGAIAVLSNSYFGNLSFTNSGSIVQATGGADGQGVIGAATVTNTGSIVTGGPAIVVNPFYYGTPSQVTNSGLIQSLNSAAIVGGYNYANTIITNQSNGVITGGTARPAIVLTPGAAIDNAGTINGDVNLNGTLPFYYSTGNSTYISDGGTLNGNLIFGAGNDTFVAFNDGTSGVTGTIDAGAGSDAYGLVYSSSATLTSGGPLPSTFERQAFGAVGSGTTLTIIGPTDGLSNGLQLFGNGTIVNKTDIKAAQVNSDPYYYYYNAVILGGLSGVGFASSLSFVNDANIAGGAQGTVASFVNNGTAGSGDLLYPTISLFAAEGDSFRFLNKGTVLMGDAPCPFYYCYPSNAVSIDNQNASKAIASVSIENMGVITGGISTSTVSQDFDFKNSGTITAPHNTYYTPTTVSITSGSSDNYLYDSSTVLVPNGRAARLDNSGTIDGLFSAYIVASDLAFSNSGTIRNDDLSAPAAYIQLAAYQLNDVQQSTVTSTSQHEATISNSGTIAGGLYLIADADNVTAHNSGTISVAATDADTLYPGSITALALAATSNRDVAVAMSNSGTITDLAYGGSAVGISAAATTDTSGIPATTAVAGGVTSMVKVVNDGVLKADGGAIVYPGFSQISIVPVAALRVSAQGDGGSAIDITNGVDGIISAAGAPATYLNGAKADSGPITAGGSIAIAARADTVVLHNAGAITGGDGTILPPNTQVFISGQVYDGSGQFLAGAIQTFNSADTLINAKTGTITGSIDLGALNDHVENYGKITGDIYLRDGDDNFVQSIGGTLDGIADGGSGSNGLAIDITGGGMLNQALLDKFVNFAAPQIIGSGAIMIGGPLAIDTLRLDNSSLTISPGQTLQTAGPMAVTGSGDVHLVNNGTIMGSVDLSSGTSSLDNSGRIAGTVAFGSGADQLTIRPGAIFDGAVTGGAGSDMVVLAEGGSDATPDELNLSTFSGFEQLRQDSGTVALSGSFTTDTVDVAAGRLIGRTGSTITASTLTVSSGATFGSAGSVNGNIAVAGTLSPGASPGTMTVTGNVALAAGSTSLFELTPAVSDQLLISGGLSIASGATLALTGNRSLAAGSALDLIVAGGGISGSFSTINKPANIIGFVAQRGNRIQLFGPFAAASGFGAQVAATIGAVNATLVSGQASTALLARLPGLLTAAGTADATAFARLNPEAYASASQIGTENGLAIATTLRSTNVRSPLAETGLFSYVQGLGAWRKLGGDSAIGTSRGNIAIGGAIGGLGVGSIEASASVFVGYLRGHQSIGGLGARNSADGELVGFNGHVRLGRFDASATLAYDGSSANTRRALPGATATSHYDLHSVLGDISLSTTRPIGKQWSVAPQIGFIHIDTRRGAGNEAGDPNFALNVKAQHYRADFADASVGFERTVGRWQPWLSVGVRQMLGGTDRSATAAFVGTTSTFSVSGVGRQRTLATGGAGFAWKASDRITVSAAYHGEYGHGGSGHHASLGLRMGF